MIEASSTSRELTAETPFLAQVFMTTLNTVILRQHSRQYPYQSVQCLLIWIYANICWSSGSSAVLSCVNISWMTAVVLPCFELLKENFFQYVKPHNVFWEWVVLLSEDPDVTTVILHWSSVNHRVVDNF